MKRNHNHRVPRATDKSLAFTVRQESGLLECVMKCLDGIARNKAKSYLTKGGVTVDGKVQTHYDFKVMPGNVVNINRQPRPESAKSPHYSIVYEDNDIVVVDKQPGVLSMGVGAGSLNMKSLLDRHFVDTRQHCTAHVVHRLDCRTSGLMVYAKSTRVQQDMTDDWHETVVDRRYVALVEGVMEQTEGRVESYLKDTKRMVVVSSPTDNGGKLAITTWRLMQQGKQHALLDLKLLTGRKNQIRVHMADIHHPVVGDGKYGAQDAPGSRMCLHAYKLVIKHPVTGEELTFETPIPPYFYRRMR